MTSYWKHFPVATNKQCEVQLERTSLENGFSFGFNFNVSWRTDHAGFSFTAEIPGIFFHFTFYDVRHWDDETNDYKIYD